MAPLTASRRTKVLTAALKDQVTISSTQQNTRSTKERKKERKKQQRKSEKRKTSVEQVTRALQALVSSLGILGMDPGLHPLISQITLA
jgi:hypothetical protein